MTASWDTAPCSLVEVLQLMLMLILTAFAVWIKEWQTPLQKLNLPEWLSHCTVVYSRACKLGLLASSEGHAQRRTASTAELNLAVCHTQRYPYLHHGFVNTSVTLTG
jgi:hypothetical protein